MGIGLSSGMRQSSEDDDMLGVDGHSTGEVKRIPIEIKPRGRLGLRSVGSIGKKQPKGGSLQSALSFDLENPEVERIRREFEMFRKNKENELASLQKKEQKLEAENKRLRAELQTLQRTCNRLRAEKEESVQAERQAMARSSAFESDRDKVQRQFKIFRETKESEIQNLLRAKRSLENKLSKVAPELMPGDSHQDKSGVAPALHSTGSSGTIRASGAVNWWTARESEATIRSLARLQQPPQQSLDYTSTSVHDTMLTANGSLEGAWNVTPSMAASSIVFKLYIGYSVDMEGEQEAFMQLCLPRLKSQVESYGRYLIVIVLPIVSPDEKNATDEQDLSLRKQLIEQCDIIAMFVGDIFSKLTVFEVTLCNDPSNLNAGHRIVFCIKDGNNSTSMDSELFEMKAEIRRVHCACIVENYPTPAEGAEAVLQHTQRLLQLEPEARSDDEFEDADTSRLPTRSRGSCNVFDEHSHLEHMEALHAASQSSSDCGFDKHYERLNGHIATPGPLPPLLVIGCPGSGKSLLLAKWVLHHQRQSCSSGGGLVLYHFVSSRGSVSADAVHMMRRFTFLLMEHVVGPPAVSCDPVHLVDEFPCWLDKVSSQTPGGVTLVIDGLDKCQAGEQHLHWLLDPLPVDARVIIAVDDETCPPAWRSWPALNVETLYNKGVREVLRAEVCAASGGCRQLSSEQESRVLTHCRTPHTCCPLYVVILAAHIASCCDERALDSRLDNLLATSDSLELYCMMLDFIRQDVETAATKGLLKKVLKFLCACRNGIGDWEVMELLPDLDWYAWSAMSRALVTHHIVVYRGGLMCIAHGRARQAIQDQYFRDKVGGGPSTWMEARQVLAQHWLRQLGGSSQYVTSRVADELPWCLQQLGNGAMSSSGAEHRQQLKDCILSIGLFLNLYARGRCHELINYWLYVGVDKVQMAELYFSATKKLESMVGTYDSEHNENEATGVSTLSKVADIYEAQSRFLRDLGLLSEAAGALQRSLELRETSLDPDDPRVARSLHRLASLYDRWSKHASAEAKYKQALEAYEGVCGGRVDHARIAAVLHSLAALYEKQGRRDAAEPLLRRAAAVRGLVRAPAAIAARQEVRPQHSFDLGGGSAVDMGRTATASVDSMASSGSTGGSDCAESARKLHDLGMQHYHRGEQESAILLFNKALEMREKVLPPDHIDIAQSLSHVAALSLNQQDLEKAEQLYDRAFAITMQAHQSDHPQVEPILRNLVIVAKKLQKPAKAAFLYELLLHIDEKAHGANDVPVAAALVNLAVVYGQLRRYPEASSLYNRALDIYIKNLGGSHALVAEILHSIALLKVEQVDFDGTNQAYDPAS